MKGDGDRTGHCCPGRQQSPAGRGRTQERYALARASLSAAGACSASHHCCLEGVGEEKASTELPGWKGEGDRGRWHIEVEGTPQAWDQGKVCRRGPRAPALTLCAHTMPVPLCPHRAHLCSSHLSSWLDPATDIRRGPTSHRVKDTPCLLTGEAQQTDRQSPPPMSVPCGRF